MPILEPEPALHPQFLLDGIDCGLSVRCWWVLQTRARQEKAAARDLLRFGIPYYLPLVKKRLVCRGRRFVSHIPLFPGYVFMFASEEERGGSLKCNRISRTLTVFDPELLVADLRQVHRLIASEAPLTVESRLAPGDRVRVRCGELEGIEGTVLRRHGQTRLLVSVNFLQKGASLEIEDFLLEPID
jgi:transcription antitermination factor NusG